MAGATGLEPAASGVTGRRSNRLSYAPAVPRVGCLHLDERPGGVKQAAAGNFGRRPLRSLGEELGNPLARLGDVQQAVQVAEIALQLVILDRVALGLEQLARLAGVVRKKQ